MHGAAVTRWSDEMEGDYELIAGGPCSETLLSGVYKIFGADTISFIAEWGERCKGLIKKEEYRDASALVFWCRKKNLERLQDEYGGKEVRVGRGLVFQIAPANVHLNSLYTLLYALLAGTPTVVRISTRTRTALSPFFKLLSEVYKSYEGRIPSFSVVNYEYSAGIGEKLAGKCDCRVIWGSDETIRTIKKISTKVDCIDICFPNRESTLVVDEEELKMLPQIELEGLARGLARDVGLYGQQACSSPVVMVVVRRAGDDKLEATKSLLELTDSAIGKDFASQLTPREHLIASIGASSQEEPLELAFSGTYLSVIEIGDSNPKECVERWKPNAGVLYAYYISSYSEINMWDGQQTSVLVPYNKETVRSYMDNVDPRFYRRLVKSGSAIGMNMNWDGQDIVRLLSRSIEIRGCQE